MKVPFRLETNFSHSNAATLWPHKYFLKGAFCLEPNLQISFKTATSLTVVE